MARNESAVADLPEAFVEAFDGTEEPVEAPDGPPAQLIAIPSDEDFAVQQAKTGERDFLFNKELEAVGKRMIKEYPELVHLAEFRIAYAWKRRGGEVKGRAQFGSIVRGNALLRMLGKTDYVIWLAADHCRDYVLNEHQRDALLYHQMCHAAVDDFGKPFAVGHDMEMFEGEVQRFGLWSLDLKQSAVVIQAAFDLGDV